jgi:hypothetical protein
VFLEELQIMICIMGLLLGAMPEESESLQLLRSIRSRLRKLRGPLLDFAEGAGKV